MHCICWVPYIFDFIQICPTNVEVLTKSGKFLNNRLLTMLGTFSKSRTFLDGTIINSANSIMAPSDLLNFDINMFGDHYLFLSLMALVMPSNREFWILSIKLNAMWLWRAQSFNSFIADLFQDLNRVTKIISILIIITKFHSWYKPLFISWQRWSSKKYKWLGPYRYVL